MNLAFYKHHTASVLFCGTQSLLHPLRLFISRISVSDELIEIMFYLSPLKKGAFAPRHGELIII